MAPRPSEHAGTVIVRHGVVVYASDGVGVLGGRPAAEVVGRSFLEFVVPEQRDELRARYEARMRGEPLAPEVEIALALPDGGRRLVAAHAERDGHDLLVHLRDLTQRETRRLRLDAVAALGAGLQREHAEEAIHALARDGLRALGLSSALMRLEPGGVRIVWAAVRPELPARFHELTGSALEGYLGRTSDFMSRVARDGYGFSDDWARDASRFVPEDVGDAARAAVDAAGIAQAIGVRLDERGSVLVVAGDWLGSDDGPAVRLFGTQLQAALEAARAIADLSQRNAQLGVLNRVASLAGEATDLEDFFARVSGIVRPVTGHASCAIFVPDEASGTLVRVYSDGGTPALDRIARIPMASPLGEVLRSRTGRVVAVPFEGCPPAFREAMDFRALAWVPLVARSRAVGVLAAGFAGGLEEASAAADLLAAVGAHCASAIEAHGLVADLRRRVGELSLLVEVAQDSTLLDPTVLLDAALRRIGGTVGADLAVAYLRDGGRLTLFSAAGLDPACARSIQELDLEDGAVGLAVRRLAPVTGETPSALGARCSGIGRCGAPGPAVAVPLLAKSDAVGALLLGRAGGEPFGDGEIALLASVGAQLGVAVEAARLFRDVRRRLADLEAVHALALRVHANAAGDVDALLNDGCRDVAAALSAPATALFLASEDRKRLHLAASVGAPALPTDPIDLARDPLSAEVMRSRAALVSDDVASDLRSAFHEGAALPSPPVLALPLASRTDVRGVLYVAGAPGRKFTAGDVALGNALAGALGVGLENAELYADARRRVEELFLLNEVGRAVSGSLELDEVLREAAEGARRLVRTARAYVLLYDAARGEIRFGAGAGTHDARLREFRTPVPQGSVIERVVREVRAQVVEDVERSTVSDVYRQWFGGRALAAVPVLLRGEPLGVLVADEERGPRRFTESDVERLTAIADRLAVAIENARLYLETRRRAEELGLLHEVGRSLVETLDIEQVLGAGVRNLARIVDAPQAHLALATPDGAHLEIRAVAGAPPGELGRRLPLDPPAPLLATHVYRRREPVVVEDARTDPRVRHEVGSDSDARAYLALPLVVRDRAIGAAVIVETRGPRRFTPSEVERAAAIANQLAVAAENARLYEDLRRSYAELGRAQQQLIAGERLAALGELSAVVAHEVRNPLGVIFNSLGSLRRLVRPHGDAKMLFDIVEEEADRLNRIVGDLLDFARPSLPELRPEHLDRVADDAVGAAVAQHGTRIELARDVDPEVPPVSMDARLVRQAILNVAVNAVQAMPRGGRITLRTRRDGLDAIVDIEDTGPGIPEEVQARIFEPFFTTKASGTGLGLAVVKRIVEGHGGAVAVRSAPGAGTVFSLRFPLAGPAVENGPAMG
jgi:PAS domain S-box-containing protein